jgi:hypothetical protein
MRYGEPLAGRCAVSAHLMREVIVDALGGENGAPWLARAAGGPNRKRPTSVCG